MIVINLNKKLKKLYSSLIERIKDTSKVFWGLIQDFIISKKSSLSIPALKIRENGFYIFPDLIKQEDLKVLEQDFEILKKRYGIKNAGQDNGRICSQGILSNKFLFLIKKAKPIVDEFLNSNSKVEISYYQESFPVDSVNDIPGGQFHVDDNKANLKLFVYLNKVGEKNGPFSFVPNTGTWKLRGSLLRAFLWQITRNRYFLYDFLNPQREYEGKDFKVLGPAGTHFIADTTSLHRAIQLKKGSRKVAVVSFNR